MGKIELMKIKLLYIIENIRIFVYNIIVMRNKDETKKEAIFKSIIQLINEIGYANTSMSKIAKLAGISASTLYTYYDNKEDMFRKVYLEVKIQMLSACSKGINDKEPVKQLVERICKNLLNFIRTNENYFLFLEQSSNSPLIVKSMFVELDIEQKPVISVFKRGIKEGILKNTSPMLLIGFCFYSIMQIYKENCFNQSIFQNIDYNLVFDMCWDAIKK